MNDPSDLAHALAQLHEAGEPFDPAAVDAKMWFLGLEQLVRTGRLDAAVYVAPLLVAAFPSSQLFARLAMLLDRMPPAVADPDFVAFVNTPGEPVQVVPRRDAQGVLFAFGGRHGALGFPLSIVHRWFGQLGLHVVYLRDASGEMFLHGIPALGSDRPSSVSALKAIATERLGVDRTLCYGNSIGGYAALLYGLEMGAAAVLGVNAFTIFPRDRLEPQVGDPKGGIGTKPPDLPTLYATAPVRPRVRLVYSADNTLDAAAAALMAGVEGLSCQAVPDFGGHDAHVPLIERGGFKALLEGFAAGWPAEPADAAAARSPERLPPITSYEAAATPPRPICGCLSIAETGSMALAAAIRAAGVKDAIRLNYLGPKAIEQMSQTPDRMFMLAKYVSARTADERQEFRFVTSVRDPIAQILTRAFQSASRSEDATDAEFLRDQAALVAWWEASAPGQDDLWGTWFDDTYKETFGFDFREHPFDHARKSLRYVSPRLRLLVVRQEDSRATKQAEIGWLIERDDVVLAAVGSVDDASRQASKTLLKSFVAPSSWIERFYDTDIMRHFYTETERAAFRARWRGRAH